MENIQAERRATLEEACRRSRDKKICPSNQKIINNRLFYSKNYQVFKQLITSLHANLINLLLSKIVDWRIRI